MFERVQLERAVGLSELGHDFMKWLGDRDRDAVLAFDQSHVAMSVPDATREWVERNYMAIPKRCRPAPEDLATFGNLVGTYLETSFDLVPSRKQFESRTGCMCPLCASLVDMSSLKTKQLSRHDKQDAWRLIQYYVGDRALEVEHPLDDTAIETIASDPALKESLATATWGRELLRRLDGHTAGPAVLVLWRMFAWTPEGSPKPRFRITATAILEADAVNTVAILGN